MISCVFLISSWNVYTVAVISNKMAASGETGYNCEFLVSTKELECPICLHVTREPHLTSCCGQHFCHACISRVLTNNKPCPFCQNQSFSVMLDKKHKRKVLELSVRCSMKEQGCKWRGELGNLEPHLETTCLFVGIACTNNCGKLVQRHLMDHHHQNCPKRSIHCEHCSFLALFEDMAEHLQQCERYPVPCPNHCGASPIERRLLQDHLQSCALRLVECEFACAGCEEQIAKKDVPLHMQQCMQSHLSLMASFCLRRCTSMQRELQKKDLQINQVQRELVASQKEVGKLEKKVQQLQATSFQLVKPTVEFCIPLRRMMYGSEQRSGSPAFYAPPGGRKMNIQLYFSSKQKIELELHQLPGEFDDVLDWPVRCRVTVNLLDQTTEENNIEGNRVFTLERALKAVQHSPDILRLNYARLASSKDYIRNDSLYFRVSVQAVN